ncbi:MAG: SAM-dependent methyltransferase [Robiginitomaculum sp.]|nr:MAG: SAM-dependent methyltransferase [Robiginitomaculum sp.]
MKSPAPLFDPARIARNKKRAKAGFANHDFLHQRVWQDLLDRIDSINRDFTHVQLQGELIPELDTGHGIAQALAGNKLTQGTKFATNLDLLVSFMELHTINDLPAELVKARQALKPDGVFLGALFGGETLLELRRCLLEAESEITGGAAQRIIPMLEVRTLGALVQRAGFSLPVIDVDTVVVRYKSLRNLVQDLRYMGERNPLSGPIRPLSKAIWARVEELYRQKYANADGLLPARFECLHICGWAPHDSQQKPLAPGSGQMFLGDALRQVKKPEPT